MQQISNQEKEIKEMINYTLNIELSGLIEKLTDNIYNQISNDLRTNNLIKDPAQRREKENLLCEKISKLIRETTKKLAESVSEKPAEIIHYRVKCDGCGMYPIRGNRYKCTVCPNFDYCEACEEKYSEQHKHNFLKIYKPELSKYVPRPQPNFGFLNEAKKYIFNQKNLENLGKICGKVLEKIVEVKKEEPKKEEPKKEEPKKEKVLSAKVLNESVELKTLNNTVGFNTILKLQNDGTEPWTSPTFLKCLDKKSDISGKEIMINREIAPGESIELEVKFNLRNIYEQGTYTSAWSLFTDKRESFGEEIDYKINCVFDE